MNLHDNTIGHIAKLIQMAILSGTDITDHLRMMRLKITDTNSLVLEEEYESIFNDQIQKMLSNSADKVSEKTEKDQIH